MRALMLALSVCVVLLCCPVARAQTPVPRFTIVSVTTDPPGPIAPGSKFKIKVIVRNDGDTIPAGRRFDFSFISAHAVMIGQPIGTPALFFGYCPGATPVNMVCQCFAAWQTGQTVEMETEVTVGSNARDAVAVTFRVTSGNVSQTAVVNVTLAINGPDMTPEVVAGSRFRVGSYVMFLRKMKNVGNQPTTGPVVMTITPPAGIEIRSEVLSYTHAASIAVGATVEPFPEGLTVGRARVIGTHVITIAVAGGGDVLLSNNSLALQAQVIPDIADDLDRVGEELLRVLEGR